MHTAQVPECITSLERIYEMQILFATPLHVYLKRINCFLSLKVLTVFELSILLTHTTWILMLQKFNVLYIFAAWKRALLIGFLYKGEFKIKFH